MATWKKVVISGSAISQLNNDANYLVSEDSGIILSGSFSGSFEGDGSGLTGVIAQAANALTDGNGINDFSYDGNTAGVTVSVQAADSTISVGAGGISVSEANLSDIPNSALSNSTISGVSLGSDLNDLTVDNATLQLNSGTTYNGSAARTISVKDGGIDTDAIADSLGTIGVNSFTGSFSGSFTGDVDINLEDLTAGAGLFGSAYDGNAAQEFSVDSGSLAGNGLDTSGGKFVVQADSTTGGNTKPVSVGANGVGFDISTIDGAGIIVTGGELAVNVDDSTIEIATDIVKVKDGGIGTTQIADSLGTLGSNSFTGSFSGSFTGDGSGLTGLATTLTVDGDTGTQDVDLLADDLQIITDATLNSAVTKVGTDVKVTLNIPDGAVGTAQINDSLGIIDENSFTGSFSGSFVGDGSGLIGTGGSIISGDAADNQVAVFNSSNTIDGYANFTFNDSTNVLTVTGDQVISQDLTVGRNLVVSGTASFQHTEDLDIADRFIRMASGSTSAGDGGIVIQQTSALDGEVFGFDSVTTRFGVSGSFDASQNTFTPDAFMAAVVNTAGNDPNGANAPDSRYQKKGNLYVASNSEDIWIYS